MGFTRNEDSGLYAMHLGIQEVCKLMTLVFTHVRKCGLDPLGAGALLGHSEVSATGLRLNRLSRAI